MRIHTIVGAIALIVLLPLGVGAQPTADALSAAQVALACAPPPTTTAASGALRVIGAQDTVARTVFSERDLLVIDGGTAQGMQLGQEYFVRRPVGSLARGYGAASGRRSVRTAGWIRIVAVNETTAIAAVERSCAYIQTGDYLEPFAVPDVPATGTGPDRSELDFGALGRVISGEDDRLTGSVGQFMLIDRGAEQGLAPGARFAIYRDVRMWMKDSSGGDSAQLPLAPIGEGVVVTISPRMSVVRILTARDAVQRGDFVVPRKK